MRSLDFIRGIAVLGIVAANIVAFGQPMSAYYWPGGFLVEHGPLSDWLWVAQFVAIDGKMRGLFSLLFGAGMALFMDKAWAQGGSIFLLARRLLWLMLFGALHFFLIWRGDILLPYGALGLVAMAALRWEPRIQLAVGLLGYLLGGAIYLALFAPAVIADRADFPADRNLGTIAGSLDAQQAAALADDREEAVILQSGSHAQFVRHNLARHRFDPPMQIALAAFETLPLMVIGMALYRLGLFSRGWNGREWRPWAWGGIVLGSLASLAIALWVRGQGFGYWTTMAAIAGFQHIPRLPVIFGLAGLLAPLGHRACGWLGERLVAAGRMAFTNYIATSLMMMAVFHPWGLGLWGQLARPQLYLVALGSWAVLLGWSKPWLERFAYGPLEWLWRCLTYGRLFPLRRKG